MKDKIKKYTIGRRTRLLEQAVNGFAEMYADLLERYAKQERQLADFQALMAERQTKTDALCKRLSAVEKRVDSVCDKVNTLSLQEKADYYSRGVLDEYMYGAAKEEA